MSKFGIVQAEVECKPTKRTVPVTNKGRVTFEPPGTYRRVRYMAAPADAKDVEAVVDQSRLTSTLRALNGKRQWRGCVITGGEENDHGPVWFPFGK